MKYFKIAPPEDADSDNGLFGIVEILNVQDEYCLEDTLEFPYQQIADADFKFDEEGGVGLPGDYQMTLFGWRMISSKFYELLKGYESNDVVYYPVKVQYKNQVLDYYLMHFRNRLDVIDKSKSKYIGGYLWTPIVDSSKLKGVHIFNYKEGNDQSFCVSEDIMKKILELNLTGFRYVKLQ